MKNFEYWKQSLESVLEVEVVTDELTTKIISIRDMEFEYTQSEMIKTTSTPINPLQKELDEIKRQNQILCDYIAKCKGVDYCSIEGSEIKLEHKLM